MVRLFLTSAIGWLGLAKSRSNLDASSSQVTAESWAFCVLILRMSACLPGILKTCSRYFDPVGQLPGLYVKGRIEQIHEDA